MPDIAKEQKIEIGLSIEDMPYLAAYVLLDSASRPAAEHQRQALTGFWITRKQGRGNHPNMRRFRGSDEAERCWVYIETCTRLGWKVWNAAAEVTVWLGKEAAEGEKIRTGYYEFREGLKKKGIAVESIVKLWTGLFFGWREWIFIASDEQIQQMLDRHKRRFKESIHNKFADVVRNLRTDEQQIIANRAWLQSRADEAKKRIVELGGDTADCIRYAVMRSDLLGRLGQLRESQEALDLARSLFERHRDSVGAVYDRAGRQCNPPRV